MNISQFKSKTNNECVRGFEYTGLDAIRDVEVFSSLRAHDIHQIDPKNKNAVTCIISIPISDNGYCMPLVLIPGMYLVKNQNGELKGIPEALFKERYVEITTEEE